LADSGSVGAASEIGGTNGHCREARELTWDIPGLSMHESRDNFPILPDPRLNAPRPIRDARVTLPTESAKEIPGGSFLSNQLSLDFPGQEETNQKAVHSLQLTYVLSYFLSFSTTTL